MKCLFTLPVCGYSEQSSRYAHFSYLCLFHRVCMREMIPVMSQGIVFANTIHSKYLKAERNWLASSRLHVIYTLAYSSNYCCSASQGTARSWNSSDVFNFFLSWIKLYLMDVIKRIHCPFSLQPPFFPHSSCLLRRSYNTGKVVGLHDCGAAISAVAIMWNKVWTL